MYSRGTTTHSKRNKETLTLLENKVKEGSLIQQFL